MDGTGSGEPPADGAERVAEWAGRFGPRRRRVHELIGLLAERDWTFAEIVGTTGVSRRTVEELLAAAGSDVEQSGGRFRIRPERAGAYRARFAPGSAGRGEPARTGDLPAAVRREVERLVGGAPRPRHTLDHVAATVDTVLRRARWLADSHHTPGLRLLCVGDHDLTALAGCLLSPQVEAAVVDLDEELLSYVDSQAQRLGLRISLYYADLRFGLPPDLTGWADVAFTDPPYTPDGVALFARRAAQGLRNRAFGSIGIAYGYGEQVPTLGLKVQRALTDLGLVYEAILPEFNHYTGAQAIGSRSDLYVCRPTSRTWTVLDRPDRGGPHIYTRGPQAAEAPGPTLDRTVADAVVAAATGGGAVPLAALGGAGWPDGDDGARLALAGLLTGGLPAAVARRDGAVAVNLADDPGPWLLRALLAVNAPRLALLVRNTHPDIGSQERQRALTGLLAGRYRLRFVRSHPTSRHAIVEATRVDPGGLDPAARLRRYLLDRSGGSVDTAWRDGLVALSRRHADQVLGTDEAHRVVQRHGGPAERLARRLADLPRHQIADLLTRASASTDILRPRT
ncbi:MAG TPA: bis-aminopropyl spermidine synthase family protein [Mycobacteriales bacterium]|nr:bis-aminopropyl spermidine synthase family protein [Mycobacteriales bacterium]